MDDSKENDDFQSDSESLSSLSESENPTSMSESLTSFMDESTPEIDNAIATDGTIWSGVNSLPELLTLRVNHVPSLTLYSHSANSILGSFILTVDRH